MRPSGLRITAVLSRNPITKRPSIILYNLNPCPVNYFLLMILANEFVSGMNSMTYNHRPQDLHLEARYQQIQAGPGMDSIDSGMNVPNPFKNGAMMMKSVSEHSRDELMVARGREPSDHGTEENRSQADRYVQEVGELVLNTGSGIGHSPLKH